MKAAGPLTTTLERVLDVRREEVQSTLLMVLYFFVAIASVCLIKPVQTGLYLEKVGVDYRLPLIYIALALLSPFLVLLYRSLCRKYSLMLLTSCTIIFLTLNLVVFWFLLTREEVWIYIVFYFWGAIFAVLLPTQGWFLSYRVYTTSAARRIFTLLGAGGILGGIAGSFYTCWIVELVGFRWLLAHVFLALVLLQIILLIVYRLNRRLLCKTVKQGGSASATGSSRIVKPLFRSSHFRSLAALVLTATLASTLVDLLYKKALDLHFQESSAEELTQFLAFVLGVIYVFSAGFQLLGTTQILRRAGLGVGLLVLPLALSLSALGIILTCVIVAATLIAVVATKFLDDSLRRSVDRTSLELLYVPMPERQSITFKSTMELVVSRLGDGLGALLFLAIITLSDQPVLPTAIAIFLAAGVWICLTLKVREHYAQTLRRSLEFRRSPAVGRTLGIDEAVADKTLITALQSPNPDKVHFALQQLIDGHGASDAETLDISDISVDMDVTGIYTVHRKPQWLGSVESLTSHPDGRVGAAALRLMMLYNPAEYQEQLAKILAATELPKRLYLVYLESYEEELNSLLVPQNVARWGENASGEEAVLLARIIGKTKNPDFLPLLEKWLTSGSRTVSRAAIRALGHYRNPEYVPLLVDFLAHTWSRRAARRALTHYGEAIVGELTRILRKPEIELSIKREVPYVLTKINTRSARAGLVASLYTYDSVISYRALRGLNAIRDDAEELSYSQESFLPLLQIWAKDYYQLINIEVLARDENQKLSRLMQQALRERKDWTVEKIFRGLELYLPMGDAYFSYMGFTSDDQELHENAVELIDSRIRGELRPTLLPLFSDRPQEDIALEGRNIFKLPSTLEGALSDALFGGDPWFKCCIIANVATHMTQNWRGRVTQSLEDISPIVRETALWALERK